MDGPSCRTRSWWAIVALVCIVSTACGSGGEGASGGDTTPDDATAALRVGMFDFDESELLAEIYAQALERAGIPVRRVAVGGPREIMAPAIEQGLIDLLPEYLGTATDYYGATAPTGPAPTIAGLRALLEPRGLTALTPAGAQNTNAFVVLATSTLGPRISDLADAAPDLRIGGPPECRDRPLCLAGLESVYGLRFGEFVAQPSLVITAEALRRDEIDVGVMFSTDATLTDEFTVLEDDRDLQPAENIVPVIRTEALVRWGEAEIAAALDGVSIDLTTPELRELNRRAAFDEIAAVAADWLASG